MSLNIALDIKYRIISMFLYIALNTNLIQNDNITKYAHSEN